MIKVETDLGFATLKCRSRDVKEITRIAKYAYSKNKKFFHIDIKKLRIIIVYSRRELNKQWGGKTEKWITSFADGKKIITFPERVIKKEKGKFYRKGALKRILTHEVNHIFYEEISKKKRPMWLLEGLACLVGGFKYSKKDRELLKKKKLPSLSLLYSVRGRKKFKKYAGYLYSWGYFVVEYLMKKHGKKKIIESLRRYSKNPTKKGFEKTFKKVFKYSVRELEKKVSERLV